MARSQHSFEVGIACLGLCLLSACLVPGGDSGEPQDFSVLAWNIWHGGREDGEVLGPQKVVEVIRESGADLVAMQETYGSGEWISAELGFTFLPRGTNVSILSRYPILEDVSVFEEFKCVGAIVELPEGKRVAIYSIWLPYDAEIWEAGTREGKSDAQLLAACESSARDLRSILRAIDQRLAEGGHLGLPVILAGDFNSMSHLDYVPEARGQYGHVIDWPTSRVATGAGFRDAYREHHPRVRRDRDRTWTPRFPEQQQDRIDFVYFRSGELGVQGAEVIDSFHGGFPSDHAALWIDLIWRESSP